MLASTENKIKKKDAKVEATHEFRFQMPLLTCVNRSHDCRSSLGCSLLIAKRTCYLIFHRGVERVELDHKRRKPQLVWEANLPASEVLVDSSHSL